MKKADRNDKYAIETHGLEKWIQICDYEDNKNLRKEQVFSEAVKPENMSKLFSLIDSLVEKDMCFSYSVNKEKQTISIKSDKDLSDEPLIRLAWKEFRITNFGGGLACDEPYHIAEIDYTKPVKKVFYWMDIHFSYTHLDGGSNGASIGTAYFYEDGEWSFKSDRELYKK